MHARPTHYQLSYTSLYSYGLDLTLQLTDMEKLVIKDQVTHLEPVDGAAVDERGEHAQSVPEGIADGAECQHKVKVAADTLDELVVHGEWGQLRLRILQLSDHLHLCSG